MRLNTLKTRKYNKPLFELLRYYAVILLSCLATTIILWRLLWVRNVDLCHTCFESICVFIAFSTFVVTWHNHERNSSVNYLLGFGFLMVAIFDSLHAYYFHFSGLPSREAMDLSTIFRTMSRLLEAIVLLAGILKPSRLRINRWAGLFFSLIFTACIWYLALKYRASLPVLFIDGQGSTPLKIFLDCLIIFLFALSLLNLKDNDNSKAIFTHRYIFIALLIAIPAEICFAATQATSSFFHTFGHVLKVVYYHFLFRGIFVSLITSPYANLRNAGINLQELLDQLPIGLANFDSTLNLSFVNHKGLEILGYSLEELQGLPMEEVAAKLRPFKPRAPIVPELLKPSPSDIRVLKSTQGEDIKLKIDALFLENGEIIYLYNEAKKEQELENLQLQTQTILNAVNNIIILADKSSKIIMCNRAFEEITEIEQKDAYEMTLDDLYDRVHSSQRGYALMLLEGRSSEEVSSELRITTPSGKKKDLLVNISPIRNIDDEVIGVIGVCSDITALKEEQRKLQIQEKLALIGQMGASIVHETKNLLATIKGCCQIIYLKTDDLSIKKYLWKIDSATNEVNKVVTDFLALSRPRNTILEEISLNNLVHSIRYMLENSSLVKGIKVHIHLAKDERLVLCDEGQIKQVILNMAKNAMEAMTESKQPTLTVTTIFDSAADEMLIRISDNGKGIPEENKSKIGTPFFSTKENGTGLGLNVCYQILEEHEGRIEMESAPGKGTTFSVFLPCAKQATLI